MTNVIQLTVPLSRQPLNRRLAGLIQCFASERRFGQDVFWLKENAELLGILECTGQTPDSTALEPLEPFYDQVLDRMAFFPQYYRFLLSITLDLEDLGMTGETGSILVDWAADTGLAEAELSDLQRAEARRLMARRGRDPFPRDAGLSDRLRGFAGRGATFAIPNKKAAYELTHIVFYLSEYGRRDPHLDGAILRSLEFAGTLAYLDQNADLLAEICVALRYAGQTPPALWENWITEVTQQFSLTEGDGARVQDQYHDYFVCNWLMALKDAPFFAKAPQFCRAQFNRMAPVQSPLRAMSEYLFGLGPMRTGAWSLMRDPLFDQLDLPGQDILQEAEANCTDFETFFQVFARGTHLKRPTRREVAL